MQNNDNDDLRESYKFFKENYNIDFSKMSPKVLKQAIELINKKLDEKIAEEEQKIADLAKKISIEHAKILKLNNQLKEKESSQ